MQANKSNITRKYSKYIFLDVVKFSKRSAEAQSDIVGQLNRIVNQALELYKKEDDCILIPTGDGMCIASINPNQPYDVHIQIALHILALLNEYNEAEKKEQRRFQVRIGINQNTDILVTDINKRRNIAGAGINIASRIMDKADGGQILVSQTVYDELQPSEQYMHKFKSFDAYGKHGLRFPVHQYIDDGCVGLNCKTPSEFIKKESQESKLPIIVAFYFAHALKQKEFLANKQGHGQNDYSLIVLLWFLALDSKGEAEAIDISPYHPKIYGEGKLELDEVFDYYNSIDFYTINTLASFILGKLSEFESCLSKSGYGYGLLFTNDKGKQKLKKEWPDIWNEFDLDTLF